MNKKEFSYQNSAHHHCCHLLGSYICILSPPPLCAFQLISFSGIELSICICAAHSTILTGAFGCYHHTVIMIISNNKEKLSLKK